MPDTDDFFERCLDAAANGGTMPEARQKGRTMEHDHSRITVEVEPLPQEKLTDLQMAMAFAKTFYFKAKALEGRGLKNPAILPVAGLNAKNLPAPLIKGQSTVVAMGPRFFDHLIERSKETGDALTRVFDKGGTLIMTAKIEASIGQGEGRTLFLHARSRDFEATPREVD